MPSVLLVGPGARFLLSTLVLRPLLGLGDSDSDRFALFISLGQQSIGYLDRFEAHLQGKIARRARVIGLIPGHGLSPLHARGDWDHAAQMPVPTGAGQKTLHMFRLDSRGGAGDRSGGAAQRPDSAQPQHRGPVRAGPGVGTRPLAAEFGRQVLFQSSVAKPLIKLKVMLRSRAAAWRLPVQHCVEGRLFT
jgi:hypothetical protein